jgi:hypothetical protein
MYAYSPYTQRGEVLTGSNPSSGVKPLSGPAKPRRNNVIDPDLPDMYRSLGFWNDLKTGRWMLIPCTSWSPRGSGRGIHADG